MADFDKPAFSWTVISLDDSGIPYGRDIRDFPDVVPSQVPNFINAFGEVGSGVTPSEWGIPIVG